MNPIARASIALALLAGGSGSACADAVAQVFEARVVKVAAAPSLKAASQETPLVVDFRFNNDACWGVADLVPLVGREPGNVSGRIRGVECGDGTLRAGRGFAVGHVDLAKPGSIWIAVTSGEQRAPRPADPPAPGTPAVSAPADISVAVTSGDAKTSKKN
jgi:hypothetical protein